TWDGTAMLCVYCAGAVSGGGGTGTITGPVSTNNCLAKEGTGIDNITCSQIVDDGAGAISYYNVSGNRHENIYAPATGVRQHNWPDVDGTVVQSIGTLTNGRLAEFNASGQLVQGNNTTTTLRTRQFGFMLGAENGSALTDGDDQPTIFVNRLG